MDSKRQAGFSFVEVMVGLVTMSMAATGMMTLVIHNSRINKAQQMYNEAQSNARASMELIVARLRNAGWDPLNAGLPSVVTDPDLGDGVSQIEIFADLDEDGATDGSGEQIVIRHADNRIEWRPDNDPATPFQVIANNITNDADDDGSVEPMFAPKDPLNPEVVVVQITARAAAPDMRTGRFITYTLRNEVALRKEL